MGEVEINNALIESRRRAMKYTNKELAVALGYNSEGTIRNKIKGIRKWTVNDIRKLIDVLDVSYEELYIN
jgi:hypothetical protein